MSASARLATFAAALVLVFGVSYVVAGAVVPDRVVREWTRSAESHDEPSTSAPVGESSTTAPLGDGAGGHPHQGGGG